MNDEQVMHAMSIDDMYHVERVLARGKGGVTELVTVEGAGPFVRKKIPNELARRSVWSALADCGCARLPQVEATYKTPDEFVVVYDFVPGDTLEALVKRDGRLDPAQAVSLVLDVCEAASALHAQGIVHRDITPKNVVASADGAHLIDLGIARLYAEGATRDTHALGTWGFAAPEQYGFKQTDARSDVYSIGRVLGYLLTGVMPDEDAYREALTDESVVPARLRAVVDRATDMEPSARYQTAADLAAALRGEKGAGAADAEESRAAADQARRGRGRPLASGRKIGSVGTGRSSRQRKWAVVVAEVMVALVIAVALLVILANHGVIPTWGGATDGGTASSSSGAASSGAVTANSASDSAASGAALADAFDGTLQIGEVGWHSEVGFITVTYSVTNTSADQLVTGSTITLTARAEDGSVLGVGKDHPIIFPGQTIWGSAVVGEGTRVGSVEAVASPVSGANLVAASPSDASDFSVKDARVKWAAGGMEALGEVVCQKRGRLAQGSIKVIVVFKDADGSVVGSLETNADYPAQDGDAVPFDINAVYVPDYATYEVFAYDD